MVLDRDGACGLVDRPAVICLLDQGRSDQTIVVVAPLHVQQQRAG